MSRKAADTAYELGKRYERTYRGCGQCVVAAPQDTFGVRDDHIFKAATGLSGGGALTCEGSCGAYVGALLVLGSLWGRERDKFEDPEGVRFRTHKLAKKFRDKYIQEYGSVVCRDVQTKIVGRPFYLADPDEFKKFHDAGAHDVHCPEVVGKAARWMAEIIDEEKLVPPK